MSTQALPDDILIVLAEEYLNAHTGYNRAERLQTIKNISLSCKALALGCRRFIFEKMKLVVGGPSSNVGPNHESAAEGMKTLFETNPSYLGLVNSLRVESLLMCTIAGKGGVMGDTDDDPADEFFTALEAGEEPDNVLIHYTSSTSEEAAICWLLLQHFPNLNSFTFIIRPINTSQQTVLRAAAFAHHCISPPKWSAPTPDPQARVVALCLPEAVVRFLNVEERALDRLILSSNLPPRILRYLKGQKPLKYLCLTKFSDVMPLIRSQVEIPFFLGMEDNAVAVVQDKVNVEEISFDESGGPLDHWMKGPACSIHVKGLHSLRLTPMTGRSSRFPFSECSKSLCTLKLVYPESSAPWSTVRDLAALRSFIIGYDLRFPNPNSDFNQLRYSLERVQNSTIEVFEVAIRISNAADFGIIQFLMHLNGHVSNRMHEWARLKTLRITASLVDEEWIALEAQRGFEGLRLRIRSSFGALLNAPPLLSSVGPVLDVSVVKDSEYSLWAMDT